jgi:hypothetical protein
MKNKKQHEETHEGEEEKTMDRYLHAVSSMAHMTRTRSSTRKHMREKKDKRLEDTYSLLAHMRRNEYNEEDK